MTAKQLDKPQTATWAQAARVTSSHQRDFVREAVSSMVRDSKAREAASDIQKKG